LVLSLLLVIIGGQHNGLLLSGSLPVLYIYIHIIFWKWQIYSAAAAYEYCNKYEECRASSHM